MNTVAAGTCPAVPSLTFGNQTDNMSSTSSGEEFVLLDSSLTKFRKKKLSVHPINTERTQYGEYYHLFKQLRRDPERFFQYTRMTEDTFNYILEKVEHRLTKNWCNLHRQPILPEERLVITLR